MKIERRHGTYLFVLHYVVLHYVASLPPSPAANLIEMYRKVDFNKNGRGNTMVSYREICVIFIIRQDLIVPVISFA